MKVAGRGLVALAAGGAGAGGFADIFEEMFGDFMGGGGRGGGRAGAGRGADLRYNMEITLEDAYNGLKTEIRVPTAVSCESCDGSGGEGGAAPVACGTCGGGRPGAFAIGVFHRRAHMPELPGHRSDHQRPRAKHAKALGVSKKKRHFPSTSRKALKRARGSGFPVKAKPGCAVRRQEIYIFS